MTEFSVIIPSYNHSSYIIEAVNSVLFGQDVDLELIVVDDGSTDNSVELLRKINDKRMTLYTQQNKGAHAALNIGLSLAKGKYIAILNSDDLYCSGRLNVAKEVFLQDKSIGLFCSYIEVIDKKGKTLGIKEGHHNLEPWSLEHPEYSFRAQDNIYLPLLTENYVSTTSNFIFTRSVLEKVGFFTNLKFTHDWDYLLRTIKYFDLFLYPHPLLKYRIHSSNTIRTNIAEMYYEICWTLARHLPSLSHLEKTNLIEGSRINNLIHSIYVGGADKALIALLSLGISTNDNLAELLLHPENDVRKTIIKYITKTIVDEEKQSKVTDGKRLFQSLINKILQKSRINNDE
ncbi:glycosyltransferase [Bellilinea caldifistulae]|uniref:glycosyltransferase n=1 Tax=Bellilinea caldifistulae TaxID=360411 RepID=UPI0007821081|nr:glycosyltransferase [Bellilinea caldifistulae]GAP09610.1 glycosyltransferase [Bellilinea caldifistulae]